LKYCALTPMVRILKMGRNTFVMSAMLQLSFCVNCWVRKRQIEFVTVIMNEQLDVAMLNEGRAISNNIVLYCDVCTVYLVLFIVLTFTCTAYIYVQGVS
jgi:ribosomal protein L16/L10AE